MIIRRLSELFNSILFDRPDRQFTQLKIRMRLVMDESVCGGGGGFTIVHDVLLVCGV